MLGSQQSNRFKVSPIFIHLRFASAIMMWIFAVTAVSLYVFIPAYRLASIISVLLMVAFLFPQILYFRELQRLESERQQLRASISNQ